ncbi:hypothetical protein TRIATDRAFT_182498, partial [Trichoderma atroviride IMI 206040]
SKTQIALDYAYRRSRDDAACAIFWVHADNAAAFERDYQTIARKLGMDNKLGGEELLFKVCDCIESQPRWLLILDNADDLALFGVSDTLNPAKSLAKYLPQGHGGSLLWTSRDKQIVAIAGARRGIEVNHMSVGEAKQLLAVTRDKDIRNEETHDAQLLLEELQWLPLAISQAGFYLRRTSTPIKEYLSKLLKDKSRWNTLKHTEHDRYRRPGIPNSVLETWDISIKHVEQESQLAHKILHTIAYLDNQNIPLSLIQAICMTKYDFLTRGEPCEENKVTLDMAILRLKEFSLISQRKKEDGELSFDMHKLTHEAIRYRLNQQDVCSRAYFLCIAASTIHALFAKNEQETWPPREKYATHAIRLLDWVEVSEAEVLVNGVKPYHLLALGLLRVVNYFCDQGLWSKAALLMERLLSIENKKIGEEYPGNIEFTSKLCLMYMHQGLYNEAEKLGLRALALSKKVHGVKDMATITIMRYLAEVYSMRGQFKDAEKLHEKVFLLLCEVRGDKHVDTIQAMENLASLYEKHNLIDNALSIKSNALMLRCEEYCGKKHPDTIVAMMNLASAYCQEGRLIIAERL